MKRLFSISHLIWWIGGLVGFHFLPHAVSAYYNRATTVDDYCFADTARTYGIGEAIYLYYTQVNGRYSGIFFHHVLNSMVWGSQLTFQLLPFLTVAGLGFLFWKLVQRYTSWPMWAVALTSAGLWIVFLDTLPSLAEGLYWQSSLHVHGFSWLTFLGVLYFLPTAHESKKSLVWAAVLVLVGGGISEATFLNLFVVIWAWGIWLAGQTKKLEVSTVLLMVLTLLGILQIKFSPANIGRQSEDISHLSISYVLDSCVSLGRFLWSQWTLSLSVLSLMILAAGSQWRIHHPAFSIPWWYVLGVIGCCLLGPYLVSSLGIGGVPPRVLNVTYLFFVLSWVYAMMRISKLLPTFLLPEVAWWITWVLFAITTLQHNTKFMYRDWYRGVYAGYAMEVDQRISQLKSNVPFVVIQPFQNRPYSIFFSEMDRNTNGLWAKCLSQYYQKPIQFIEN